MKTRRLRDLLKEEFSGCGKAQAFGISGNILRRFFHWQGFFNFEAEAICLMVERMSFCSSLKISRLNAELFGNYERVLSAYFQFVPDELAHIGVVLISKEILRLGLWCGKDFTRIVIEQEKNSCDKVERRWQRISDKNTGGRIQEKSSAHTKWGCIYFIQKYRRKVL